MSRKEKELKLREAATKLKIRTLKQQLLNSTGASASVMQPLAGGQVGGAAMKHQLICNDGQPHPQEYYIQQAKEILASCGAVNSSSSSQPPPASQATQKPHTPHHNNNGSQPPHQYSHGQHDRGHTPSPQSHALHFHPAHNSVPCHHSSHSHTLPVSLHISQSSNNHAFSNVSQGHTPPSKSSHSLAPSTSTRLTQAMPEPSSQTTPTKPAARLPPTQPMPEKLTLPEEIKETQYMTAVQRQKARVNRIRRYMVAATVIQRAWRRKHPRT